MGTFSKSDYCLVLSPSSVGVGNCPVIMRFFSGSGATVPTFSASHKEETLLSWTKFDSIVQKGCVDLDGEALDIASVAAVARYSIISFSQSIQFN